MSVARNDPCPCGSGRKYKRCCLAATQELSRVLRVADLTGEHLQAWAMKTLRAELDAALEEFLTLRAGDGRARRRLSDADADLFSSWFHNDRRLPEGDTPAERYAQLPELHAQQRAAAQRIASAHLSLYRVHDVVPGEWLLLEDLTSGERTTVSSATVSRDAARWDLVIGRLVTDGQPGLWGATRIVATADEQELLVELARLGGGDLSGTELSAAAITDALARHPLEVMCFQPPGWNVAPTFYTLEGDPVADASATWPTRDRRALEGRLRRIGHLAPGDEPSIDITMPRARLVRERGELPPGALVLESAVAGDLDNVPIASLRLDGDRLELQAMSEERLERAIEVVLGDFGDLLESLERSVVAIEERLAERAPARQPGGHASEAGLDEQTERALMEDFLTDRMHRWVEDPHAKLGGLTPRQAADGDRRNDLIRLVRALENGAERARYKGEPHADLSWLRGELGLGSDLGPARRLAA